MSLELDQASSSSVGRVPQSFTLAGRITDWDPNARRLRILNLDVILAPHVSPLGLASGVVVFVKGHYDDTTGQRIATRLSGN